MTKEQTFVTDGSGAYSFSTIVTDGDYDRPLSSTEWDRSNERKLIIVTPSDWQYLQSGIVSNTGVYRYARARGDQFIIDPDASGDTLVFEYISSFYAKDNAGTAKATFTADDDSSVFPEHLVELGLKYYLKTEYGLPSIEDGERYYDTLDSLAGQERPKQVIGPNQFFTGQSHYVVNIPDSGAGQ